MAEDSNRLFMNSLDSIIDGKHNAFQTNYMTTAPIGVFWDIENCNVPKNKSAFDVVQAIRVKYFELHREAEFMCVCDVNKESKDIIKELNDAQVVIVHVDALSKNAADIKLRQCMQKFSDIHGPPATIILISGDINFAPDLSDLRYRRQFNIVVIHNGQANMALLACAHQSITLAELTSNLPNRSKCVQQPNRPCKLVVSNVPTNVDAKLITQRLHRLSENCGGKVCSINGNRATIRFSSPELTKRAKKRMDKEDVCGNIISVNYPPASDKSKKKSVTPVKDKKQLPPPEIVRPQPRPHSNPLLSYQSSEPPHIGTQSLSLNRDKSPTLPSVSRLNTMFEPLSLKHDSNGVGSTMENYNSFNSFTFNTDDEPSSYFWEKETIGKTNGTSSKSKFSDGVRQVKAADSGYTSASISSKVVGSAIHKEPLFNRGWPSGSSGTRSTPSPQFEFNGNAVSVSNGVHKCDTSHLLSGGDAEPVELQITNLDPNIDVKHLKQHLLSLFRDHVMVLHVYVTLNVDGNISAGIKVPSMSEAQYAISKLHRTRLGSKRISISIASNVDVIPLNVLRSEVVALLMDVPVKRLALFKFRELYEKRYHRSIGISELYRLKDIISIQENAGGKTVVLNSDFRRNTPSPAFSDGSKEVQDILEMAYCEMHLMKDAGKGWAEKEQATQLPSVMITLKTLTSNVHSLLQLHGNGIPLNSFPTCYQCVFGNFEVIDSGVPLEHLVTIVPGVRIARNFNGIKFLDWIKEKGNDCAAEPRSISPPLASQLSLLCREIVDLLKNQCQCRISFNKFIPIYHHHFSKQCRVADYGYTRLLDLLEAIPHVVQILGDGNKRVLTLTHRAQVKRFNADLLRILKSQVSKEVAIKDFADVYLKCLGKEFNIVNYGVCDVLDMLGELAEGIILVTGSGDDVKIQLPKREQSPEEAERTKQFKLEAMELLRNSPRCRMGFTKFIPSYHHHFSKQCRVADYGFTKLIELFEAIPDIVEVKPGNEDSEDRILQLAEPRLLEVFTDQITSILRVPGRQIVLEKLLKAYIQQNGYSIYPEDYEADDVVQLLEKISTVKVVDTPGCVLVSLIEKNPDLHLSLCVKKILLKQPDGKMDIKEFCALLEEEYRLKCDIQYVVETVGNLISVEGSGNKKFVRIDRLQLLMKDVVQLLQSKGGRVLLANFDEVFIERHKRPCVPAQFGHSSLASLLQSIHEVAVFKGRSTKRAIVLNLENVGLLSVYGEQSPQVKKRKVGSLPQNTLKLAPTKAEGNFTSNVVDLMNDPIPLRIPSPALRPQPVSKTSDELIIFDSVDDCCDTNGFDTRSTSVNGKETLSLVNLARHEKDSFCFLSPLSTLPLFQTCFSPASSLLPPVPYNWKQQSLSSQPASPPNSYVSSGIGADVSPGTPTASFNDFSDLVMSTPPCIRELIANSSPETSPTKTPTANKVLPRMVVQFTNS